MAVTLISPPIGVFPASTTPVRFTVDNLVGLVIGVDHSDVGVSLPVELIYADGVFLYPYLGSTLVGNTFSILRTGGWASFEERNKVRVFEQAPLPTKGQALGLIYEVDVRTLANQTIAAAGSYVIDGKVWWAKGSLTTPVAMSSALVNGSGLRLSTTGATALPLASGAVDYASRMMVLPLTGLADYNPLAPVLVRAKFTSASVAAVGWIGLIDTTSDAVNYLAANRSAEILTGTPSGSPSATVFIKRGTAVVSSCSMRSGSIGFTDRLLGVQRFNPGFADNVDQSWNGVGAVPADSGALPQNQGLSAQDTGVPTNPCVAFFLQNQSGTPLDVYLTHLSISQPRVAA